MTGGLKYGVRNSAKKIMLTLSSVGTKAGTEKRFQVLRIAPASEDSEISNISGNVTRRRLDVSSNFSGVSVKPGAVAQMTQGAAIIPSKVTSASTRVSMPLT